MKPNPFQALPETVEVGGRDIKVDTDFRVGVAIEQECAAAEPDVQGLLEAFYLGSVPHPVEEAVQKMIEFYSHQDGGGEKKEDSGKPGKRAYDFTQDADALLSSFLDAYGLDLSTAKIHWWTFKRLLCNLPPETPFMRRLYYRTADPKKMSKSERKHVEKMRRLYALKSPEMAGKSAEELDRDYLEKVRRRYEEAKKQVNETKP